MFNIRSAGLVLALFAAGFFGVRWVLAGAPIPLLGIVPLTPDPRLPTFTESARRHIAEGREQQWLESKTAQSDGDPERNKLRAAVVEAATAFALSPCSATLKQQFIEATTAYAQAYLTLGGCPKFPNCTFDDAHDARMERASQAFKSPADGTAKQAIRAVHEMGIQHKDYPRQLGGIVARLTDSGFSFDDEFSCTDSRAHEAARNVKRPIETPAPQPRNWDERLSHQNIERESRERTRNRTIADLRRPGPAWCNDPGRSLLVAGINQYYNTRDGQVHRGGIRTPEERAEVERAWSTALDQQIEGLVREFLMDGYFRRQDIDRSPSPDRVLSGVTSSRSTCANKG